MNMVELLAKATNYTHTTNGAVAYEGTLNSVLDLFASGGAVRRVSEEDVIRMVDKAYSQNKYDALAVIFYLLDVREGQGERRFGKVALRHLAKQDPSTIEKVLPLIPEYSRWDMMYAFVGTQLQTKMFDIIAEQLQEDMDNEFPSLMAKWLKSENASNAETIRLGKITRQALNLTPKIYRKVLSQLRNRLNVVETLITTKNYDAINYKNIPSKALMKYTKAFYRNDEARITEFYTKVKSGEVKMREQTVVNPNELVRMTGGLDYYGRATQQDRDAADAIWNNLPDYMKDATGSVLSVVDTSGSMSGEPLEVAVALGIYTAERAKGPFKDHFITFSSKPKLQKVQGTDLYNKVKNLKDAEWQMNTNIEATFDLILNTAVRNRLPQSDLPSKLLIISDMQFDSCAMSGAEYTGYSGGYYGRNNFDEMSVLKKMKAKFAASGYELPQIMFWQVNATAGNFPMEATEAGSIMVSGFSPTILKYVLAGKFHSPVDGMFDVIHNDRYKPIYFALTA
jgi:hypothetical protein